MSYQYKKSSILYELEQAIKKKVAEKPKAKDQCQRNVQNSVQKRKSQNPRQSVQRLPSKHKEVCKPTKQQNFTLFNNENLMHVQTHQTESKLSQPKKLNHRKIDKLFSLINYALSSADKAMKYINYANFQGEFAVKLFKSDKENLMNQMRNMTAEDLMDSSSHRDETSSKVTVPSVIILQEQNLKLKKQLAILQKQNERSRQGHPKDMDLALLLRQLQIQKYKESIYRLKGNEFVQKLSAIVEKELKYESLLRKGHASSTEFDSIFRSLISQRNNLCKEASSAKKLQSEEHHQSQYEKINKIKQEKQELMREIEVCKKKLGEITEISVLKSELESFKREYMTVYNKLLQTLPEGEEVDQELSIQELLARVIDSIHAMAQNYELQSQVNVLRSQKSMLQQQISSKQQKIRAMDRSNVEFVERIQGKDKEMSTLKHELSQFKKKAKINEEEMKEIEKENVYLMEKVESLEAKIGEYERSYQGEKDSETPREDTTELMRKLDQKLFQMEGENKALIQNLELSKEEIAKLNQEISQMEIANAQQKEEIGRKHEKELETLLDEKNALWQELQVEKEKVKTAQKNQSLNIELEQLRSAHDEAIHNLKEKEEQLRLKNQHIDQTKGFLRQKTIETFSKINEIAALKQNQQQLATKIQSLQLQLKTQFMAKESQNEIQISRLTSELSRLEKQIEILKEKLEIKNQNERIELEKVEEMKKELQKRMEECGEKEGEILDKEYGLKKAEQALIQKQSAFKEKDQAIQQLETKLNAKLAQLALLEQSLKQKQNQITLEIKQLKEKQKQFEETMEKEKKQQQQSELQRQNKKEEEEANLKLQQKDQQYLQKIEKLSAKNVQALLSKQKLEEELTAIKQQLSNLLSTYNSITVKLEALEHQQKQVIKHLNEKEERIVALNEELKALRQKFEKEIQEKEAQATKKETILLERCGVLSNELIIKAEALDEASELQASSEAELTTKNQSILQLEAKLKGKDSEIETLRSQLEERQSQISQLESEKKESPSEDLEKLLSTIQTMQQQIEDYASQQEQRQIEKEIKEKRITELEQQLEEAKAVNGEMEEKYAEVVMKLELTIINGEQLLEEKDKMEQEFKDMETKMEEIMESNRLLSQWKSVQMMYEKQYCNLIKRILKAIIDLDEIGNMDEMGIRTLLEIGSQKVIEHRMRVRDQESNQKRQQRQADDLEIAKEFEADEKKQAIKAGLFDKKVGHSPAESPEKQEKAQEAEFETELKDVQEFQNFEDKMNSSLISEDGNGLPADMPVIEDKKQIIEAKPEVKQEQQVKQDIEVQKEKELEDPKVENKEQSNPFGEVENIEEFNDYQSEKMNESMLSNPEPKTEEKAGLGFDQFNDDNHSQLDSSLMSQTNLPQSQPQNPKQETAIENFNAIGMDLSHISNNQPHPQNNSMEFENFLDFQTNNLNQSMVSEKGVKDQKKEDSGTNNFGDFNDFQAEKLSQSMISEKEIEVPVHKQKKTDQIPSKTEEQTQKKAMNSLDLDNFDDFKSQRMNDSILSNQEPVDKPKEQANLDQFGDFKQDSMNSSMISDKDQSQK